MSSFLSHMAKLPLIKIRMAWPSSWSLFSMTTIIPRHLQLPVHQGRTSLCQTASCSLAYQVTITTIIIVSLRWQLSPSLLWQSPSSPSPSLLCHNRQLRWQLSPSLLWQSPSSPSPSLLCHNRQHGWSGPLPKIFIRTSVWQVWGMATDYKQWARVQI